MIAGYTKEEYVREFVQLWEDAVRTVYLKEPGKWAQGMGEKAWDHTRMTPLRYVNFTASPHNMMNWSKRGQKAREKRWKKWLKSKGVEKDEMFQR